MHIWKLLICCLSHLFFHELNIKRAQKAWLESNAIWIRNIICEFSTLDAHMTKRGLSLDYF